MNKMCDLERIYNKKRANFDQLSEICPKIVKDGEFCVKSARVVGREGLRMRIAKNKVSVKPNIEEEFIKKGFEFEARFPNAESLQKDDTDDNEDKDQPIAPYLCEVVQKPTTDKPITIKDPNPFHCQKCPKKFPRLQQLKQHQMVHSDYKPFECTYCQRRFKKASHLKTHTLTHTDDSPYKCLECNKKFTQDAALKLHMQKHTGVRPYLCKHCGKSFPKLYTLQRHELMHDEDRILKMKEKRQKLLWERNMAIEVETVIEIDPNEKLGYNTEFIKKINEEYNEEIRNQDADPEKRYKDIVNELSTDLKNLHRENNIEDGTTKEDDIAPYLCEIIEGADDPNNEGKAFQCTKCFKRFSRLTYLKQHQMTHSDYKPFPCTECPMRFKKASHLKTHSLTHTDDSPYKCTECNKNFTQDASLKSHMLAHSGIKPYSCKDCGKRFTKLYTLQRHELTHTEDRPYQCVLCYKKFSDISNLKRHEMTHSNSKPFNCLQCNKKFSQLTHLKRHKVTHDIKNRELSNVKSEEVSKSVF